MMQTPKPTILLVDDDADLRETLADGLEAAGYEVIQAGNIQGIMGRLPSMRLSAVIVDLVLMGVSGAALLGYVKAHPYLKNVKVIMISGFDHAKSTANLWKADGFLQKPVTIARLIEALNAVGVSPVERDHEHSQP
jgi:DNA-binding NtrC family response regulator